VARLRPSHELTKLNAVLSSETAFSTTKPPWDHDFPVLPRKRFTRTRRHISIIGKNKGGTSFFRQRVTPPRIFTPWRADFLLFLSPNPYPRARGYLSLGREDGGPSLCGIEPANLLSHGISFLASLMMALGGSSPSVRVFLLHRAMGAKFKRHGGLAYPALGYEATALLFLPSTSRTWNPLVPPQPISRWPP